MPAYMLFIREGEVFNPAEMEIYSAKNRASPPDPNLTPLVIYGKLDVVEGEAPDGIILLQFPTMEAARDWYYSPAYQAAAEHRKRGAHYRAMFIEGL